MEYRSAGDWRIPERAEAPVPCVTTSREHGSLLMKSAGKMLTIEVDSTFYDAKTQNVDAHLKGNQWPETQLILEKRTEHKLGRKYIAQHSKI